MAVLLGLVVVAGVLLGGRIPDVRTGPEQQPQNGAASLIGVITLLAASVLIMAIALAASFRRPVPDAPADRRELPREVSGPRARPSRRMLLLIAAALTAGWLFALLLGGLLGVEPTELGYQPPADRT
ncbi:MAG: hypothetical protein WAO90_06095, partial [Mycobacterium sp.]